jgi:hypothetical protein
MVIDDIIWAVRFYYCCWNSTLMYRYPVISNSSIPCFPPRTRSRGRVHDSVLIWCGLDFNGVHFPTIINNVRNRLQFAVWGWMQKKLRNNKYLGLMDYNYCKCILWVQPSISYQLAKLKHQRHDQITQHSAYQTTLASLFLLFCLRKYKIYNLVITQALAHTSMLLYKKAFKFN